MWVSFLESLVHALDTPTTHSNISDATPQQPRRGLAPFHGTHTPTEHHTRSLADHSQWMSDVFEKALPTDSLQGQTKSRSGEKKGGTHSVRYGPVGPAAIDPATRSHPTIMTDRSTTRDRLSSDSLSLTPLTLTPLKSQKSDSLLATQHKVENERALVAAGG